LNGTTTRLHGPLQVFFHHTASTEHIPERPASPHCKMALYTELTSSFRIVALNLEKRNHRNESYIVPSNTSVKHYHLWYKANKNLSVWMKVQ